MLQAGVATIDVCPALLSSGGNRRWDEDVREGYGDRRRSAGTQALRCSCMMLCLIVERRLTCTGQCLVTDMSRTLKVPAVNIAEVQSPTRRFVTPTAERECVAEEGRGRKD